MKKLLLVGAVGLALQFGYSATRWTGSNGTVDWSDGGKWSEGVPASDGTAEFSRAGDTANYYFKVTPPSDFHGQINVAAGSATAFSFRPIVELTVLDGADWTVIGDGTVVATEGVAARLSADFTGEIEIPAGSSFVAPASLNASVSFIGAGELTLSTTEQLDHIYGFFGKVKLPNGVVAPTDTSLLQDRTFELSDGSSVQLGLDALANGKVTEMPDWQTTGTWSLNGKTARPGPEGYPYNQEPAHVLDNGDLMLVDSPEQKHSAFYTGRKFSLNDSWGCSFRLTTVLPNPSMVTRYGGYQAESGCFAICLQSVGPENYGTTDSWQLPVNEMYGFRTYTYRGSKNPNVTWLHGGIHSSYDYFLENCLNGVSLLKPIDFKVVFHDGIMYVTMIQEGHSRSFSHSYKSYLAARGKGVWFGLGGASDSWGDYKQVPWNTFRVSGFQGWYSGYEDDSAWSPVAVQDNISPFSAANWRLTRKDNNTSPATVLTGDDCVGEDGSFMMMGAAHKFGGQAVSKQMLAIDKRYRITFDVDWGVQGVDAIGDGLYFGLAKYVSTNWQWDNGYVNPGSTYIPDSGWGVALGWKQDYYNKKITGLCMYAGSSTESSSAWSSPVTVVGNTTANYTILYNGQGLTELMIRTKPASTSSEGTASGRFRWAPKKFSNYKTYADGNNAKNNQAYLVFKGSTPSGWSTCFMQTTIRNVCVKELTGNANPRLGARIAVAANATATVDAAAVDGATPAATLAEVELGSGATLQIASSTANAKAAVENVTASGAATLAVRSGAAVSLEGLTLSGEANASSLAVTGTATADELTVVVPSAWRKYRAGKVTLVSGLSVDPANVTLCDENGPIPEKKGNVVLENGVLKADFQRGMILIFR